MGLFKNLFKKVKKMKLLRAKNILPLLAVATAGFTGGLSLGVAGGAGGFSGALSSISALGQLSGAAGLAMSGVGHVVGGDIGKKMRSFGKVATTAGGIAMGGAAGVGGVHGAATGLSGGVGLAGKTEGLVKGAYGGVKGSVTGGFDTAKGWVGLGQSVPGSTTPMKGSEVNDVNQITNLDSDAIGPEAFGVPQGTGAGGTLGKGEGQPGFWKATTGGLSKGLKFVNANEKALSLIGKAAGSAFGGSAKHKLEGLAHELAEAEEARHRGETSEEIKQQMRLAGYNVPLMPPAPAATAMG